MTAKVSQSNKEVSRIYQEEANLDGSRICQGSIGQTKSFSMDREAVEKVQDDHYKWLNWRHEDYSRTAQKKCNLQVSIPPQQKLDLSRFI